MSKRISQWELVDHGTEHSQMFGGCGTSFTKYEHCATGCGDNPHEAFEDLLEMIAQTHDDIDLDQLEKDILSGEGIDKMPDEPSASKQFLEDTDWQEGETEDDVLADCELHYYMSLRYNVEDDPEADGPQEGDITTTDYTNFYQDGKLVLCTLRGCYMPDSENEQDQWKRHVKAYMDSEAFWPNVWFISDHGNAVLLDLGNEPAGEVPL